MVSLDLFPVTNKTFLVLGLARSGIATLKWLQERGAHVIVSDQDPEKCRQAAQMGATEFNLDHKIDPTSITALVQSPGIPLSHPLTQWAQLHHVPIISDCDLFRAAHPEAKIVGITGTNGKSTTTALIGHILDQAKIPVAIGGNIGMPVLSLPLLPENGIYVWELSSYQLELSHNLSLNYVGWLNITPDHLERHGTMEGYVQAKKKIFKSTKASAFPSSIISIDDDYSHQLFQYLSSNSSEFFLPLSTIRPIDNGLFLEDSILWDVLNKMKEKIIDFHNFCRLKGAHNYQNMAIAYGICVQIGLSKDIILKGMASFPGLAHRQEWITERDGIAFVNDSKATNAEAAAKALHTFDHIFWIAGGVPKTDGIESLQPYFTKIKRAFLIGEAQHRFAHTLESHVPYVLCGDLKTALHQAYDSAQDFIQESVNESSDDRINAVVLLSPACASFDQFKDFEDRGDVFRALVRAL